MKQFISLIVLLLLISKVYSQNYADKEFYLIDSLEINKIDPSEKELLEESLKNFHKAKSDSNKIKALSSFIENSWDDNLWPKYNKWVYTFTENRSDKHKSKTDLFFYKAHTQSLINIGFTLMITGKTEEAKKLYNICLNRSRKINNEQALAAIHNNLASIYEMQGKIKDALKHFEITLELLKKNKQNENIGAILNNIASIYDDLGDKKIALEYYHKSLKHNIEVSDIYGMSICYNNLGSLYSDLEEYDKSLMYYKKSNAIMGDNLSDKKGFAISFFNIGDLYYRLKQYDSAMVYVHKAIKLHKQVHHTEGILVANNTLGKICYQKGDLKQAISYLNKGYELAVQLGYPSKLSTSSKSLSIAYQDSKNWKKALYYYKVHIKMRDSLNNESTQKAAIKQQAKFEYEKQKTLDDAEHEKQIAIEQEAAEKQTIITYATAGGLGLVGIFLLVVFNRLKVTRKQKNIIEEQKQEVESQKEEVEHAHAELEEKNKEITDSIQYAKRIQNAILPPAKVVKEYLTESFIYYKPKDIVAGDFYWMESVSSSLHSALDAESPKKNEIAGQASNDDLILFAAADCTGHGVPGAMVSVVCNNGLNRSVREYGLTDPGKILDKTREIVVQEFEKSEEEVKDGMDIALCSLQLNSPFEGGERGMTLKYAGAHNPLWIIRKEANEIEEIKANKQPIGKFDNPEPYTTHTLELQKGDTIYIFSDGYADQFGGDKGKKLKTTNFKKLLLSIQKEPMEKQRQLIDEAFEKWKGNIEQLDDVCVIGVRM